MLKRRTLSSVAFLLIAAMLITPVFAIIPGADTAAGAIPVGFIAGDEQYGSWFYKETERYVATLHEQEDGNYHLTYTFRNIANNPVYEKTITPSELIRVEQYIEGTQTGYVPVGTTQCVIPDTDQSEADAEPLSSQSYWLSGVKGLMRIRYPKHTDLTVVQSYEIIEDGSLKYKIRIRESMYYDAERMGLKELPEEISMAAAAVDVANDLGLPLPVAVNILKTVVGLYDGAYQLQQMYCIVAYRGVVQYERIGTAQNVGESEQYYNVVATKSIVEYLGAEKVTVNSNVEARDHLFFTNNADEIYTPSEYEFDVLTMRNKVMNLHD